VDEDLKSTSRCITTFKATVDIVTSRKSKISQRYASEILLSRIMGKVKEHHHR
jgi:hypothetical protein